MSEDINAVPKADMRGNKDSTSPSTKWKKQLRRTLNISVCHFVGQMWKPKPG
jgi:hypothetical protein